MRNSPKTSAGVNETKHERWLVIACSTSTAVDNTFFNTSMKILIVKIASKDAITASLGKPGLFMI
jgi:hypothetical protein